MPGGPGRSTALRVLGYVLAWLVVAVPVWFALFFGSSAPMVVASHDATVSPAVSNWSHVRMGPYLPDFRVPRSGPIAVEVDFGKTSAVSAEELVRRYALLGNRPQAAIRRIEGEVVGLARDAALRAAVAGLVPIALWVVIGPKRRAELSSPTLPRAVALAGALSLVGVAVAQPWQAEPAHVQPTRWISLAKALPGIPVPRELRQVEVQGGLLTANTRKFISSAFDSFERSTAFFQELEAEAASLAGLLRTPEEDETVAVLVSDRHDNISMDGVVRAVADLAGATVIIDAGDDTSTGEPWEAFSLDSLDEAFDDYDSRIMVAGNHDHGGFVADYLSDLGWTHLDAEPVQPFGGVQFLGVDDPRSSGLGSWRDEKELTFDEVRERLGDEVCQLDEDGERVATVVVHDANLARTALERGCTDLVLSGHLHLQVGPERIVGENGKVGYRYTNGTTGGAAYAIAIASKLRREAEFTFVTYRDQRPAGIQPVRITPAGKFIVEPYVELDLGGVRAAD